MRPKCLKAKPHFMNFTQMSSTLFCLFTDFYINGISINNFTYSDWLMTSVVTCIQQNLVFSLNTTSEMLGWVWMFTNSSLPAFVVIFCKMWNAYGNKVDFRTFYQYGKEMKQWDILYNKKNEHNFDAFQENLHRQLKLQMVNRRRVQL